MRVEVIKAFGAFSVGTVIPEMPGNQARTLIGRGLVRALEASANRMIGVAPVQKAKRPGRRDGAS
jgi:hypothetical protein